MTDTDRASVRRRHKEELKTLQTELQARMAEAEWLKAHYDEQLRAAFAQIAVLQAQAASGAAGEAAPQSDPVQAVQLEQLQREVERLSAAEACYLDRIEELKEAIERERGADD